jgi:chaperonin cofactor prefoldin
VPITLEELTAWLETPEGQTWSSKFVETQVTEATVGLKNNRDALLTEKKQLQDKLQTFEGLTPEELNRLRTLERDTKDKVILDNKGIDALVNERTERLRTGLEQRIDELSNKFGESSKQAAEAREKFQRVLIERVLSRAAAKHKVRPEAVPDVMERALRYGWKLKDGVESTESDDVVEAVTKDGTPRYGIKNPAKPISIDEYFSELLPSEAPHFYSESVGGGATTGLRNRGVPVIKGSDARTISRNLEDIASGKVMVNMDE